MQQGRHDFEVRLDFDWQKLRKFIDNIAEFQKHLAMSGRIIAGKIAGRPPILDVLKATTPKSEGPGPHLADMWTMREELGAAERFVSSIIFENMSEQCAGLLLTYLEYGTRPHEIRGNPILRFEVKNPVPGKSGSESHVVYTRLVHHPGTKPYHIVADVMKDLDERVRIFMDSIKSSILEEVTREAL